MTYNDYIQSIIDTRGQWNIPEGEYYEAHHIIPVCMGGLPKRNKKLRGLKHENIIWLYPHEHLIAHKLLYEENPKNKSLTYAYWCLCNENAENLDDYDNIKKSASLCIAELKKGHLVTDETKNKISNSLKGNIPWNKGIPCREETKEKLRIANKGQSAWNKGVPMKPETKEKLRVINLGHVPPNKGVPMKQEAKEKLSLSLKGKQAWNKGIPCREETKEKLREINTGKKHSDETKAKISAGNKGKKHHNLKHNYYVWINNGTISHRVPKTDLDKYDEAWVLGRIKNK